MGSRGLLYQVSTSSALVEGVYEGAVLIGALRKHGNLGLGTFENLDGEMVIVDGHFFQVHSDGSVHEVGDEVASPFAVVTHFKPDLKVVMNECPNLYYRVVLPETKDFFKADLHRDPSLDLERAESYHPEDSKS